MTADAGFEEEPEDDFDLEKSEQYEEIYAMLNLHPRFTKLRSDIQMNLVMQIERERVDVRQVDVERLLDSVD